MSRLAAGLLALLAVAVGVYFGFAKEIPFKDRYTVRAVVESSNALAPNSPVRIAGVDIGKVERVGRYRDSDLALITMRIDAEGRPVRRDATLKIRPRLFLEGNFYVDLQPGTPRGAELPDDGLIPLAQTSTPVQLDQVLTALQANTRGSLKQAVQGFGAALDAKPTRAEDAVQDPAVRGLTGAQGLNATLRTSPDSLRDSATVAEALRGPRPRDLSRTIRGLARTMGALARRQDDLRHLVTDFDATMGALARREGALHETVRELGPTATHADEAFASLAGALPPTRAFARELSASLPELPGTIDAAGPWLAQARSLLGTRELGGLLKELQPATGDLARLGDATRRWLPRIDAFNRCVTDVILPTGNVKVDDGPLSAGVESYKEFWYAMVGQAGEGQSFDGNGPLLRLSAAGGANTIETGKTNYSGRPLFSKTSVSPTMTRPAYGNRLPSLRRDIACATQPIPDVNGPASRGPADGSARGAAPPPAPLLSEAKR